MTQQSYRKNSAEADSSASSSSSSASTSSNDVYPLPLSLGQKKITLNDEQWTVVSEPTDTNVETVGANICINDSSHIHIGNNTYIHKDAIVRLEINANDRDKQNGVVGQDEDQCNKTDGPYNHTTKGILQKWRYLIIFLVFLLFLFLILISLYIFYDDGFRNTSFPPINPNTSHFIQRHPVYSKFNWGALPAKELPPLLMRPTAVVIISHSATQGCASFKECTTQIQRIQSDFQNKGDVDIGYNFLIGEDGGIYEGRGWERQNSLRAKTLSVSFIGDFNKQELGKNAQKAAKALLEDGVNIQMLSVDYKLIGENQTSPIRFYSPGWNATKVIKNWKHYFPGTML